MNSGNRSKRVSLNRRGGIAGFFWGNLSKSRRLTGIAFAMLLLASAVAAVLYINFGDSLAAVKAEVTSGSDYDSADGENTDAEDDFDPDADPAFGHLFIDNDPDGVIEDDGFTQESAELCHQSFELYPDENEEEKSVTLYGMMPEGASAEAIDVSGKYPEADDVSEETSDDADVVVAYNITISNGELEYQPDESCPVRVEIADPGITAEGVTEVWHIMDDGTREKITDFTVTDGKVGFFALGFSVYAIVNAPEPYVAGTGLDPLTSLEDLNGRRAAKGLHLSVIRNGANQFFKNTLNTNSCLIETTSPGSAAV